MSLINGDQRVYLLCPLINAILDGQELRQEHREKFIDYPVVLNLLDYVRTLRGSGLTRYHATPGPNATIETFAESIMEGLKVTVNNRKLLTE